MNAPQLPAAAVRIVEQTLLRGIDAIRTRGVDHRETHQCGNCAHGGGYEQCCTDAVVPGSALGTGSSATALLAADATASRAAIGERAGGMGGGTSGLQATSTAASARDVVPAIVARRGCAQERGSCRIRKG